MYSLCLCGVCVLLIVCLMHVFIGVLFVICLMYCVVLLYTCLCVYISLLNFKPKESLTWERRKLGEGARGVAAARGR